GLADRGGDGSELPGELINRMAEAVAETHPWKERPHALGRAIKAIGESPFDPVRWLVLDRYTLKLPIGLRKGNCTGLRGIAQMPDHAPMNNGRQVDFSCQTRAVLLIGEDIDGQSESTPGQHGDQTLLPQRTDQTVEGHGRDMVEHRAPLQTEATVRGQQRITGDIRAHLAIA